MGLSRTLCSTTLDRRLSAGVYCPVQLDPAGNHAAVLRSCNDPPDIHRESHDDDRRAARKAGARPT